MNVDQKGINFLINEEGIVLHPYLDVAGIPTIGVGCTYYTNGISVTLKDPFITKEQAIDLFKHILYHYELAVTSYVCKTITQNQFNALVSFCYNEGTGALKSSTLLKIVNNNPQDIEIKDEFLKWDKAKKNGVLVVNKDLLERRQREANLYFTK